MDKLTGSNLLKLIKQKVLADKTHFTRFFKTLCLYNRGFEDASVFQYEVVQKGTNRLHPLPTNRIDFVTKHFMELKNEVRVTRMNQKKSAICLIILYFFYIFAYSY